jgi:hypothetical protein
VAHAYNCSYSECSNQEDRGLKPAWANSLRDPILKKKKNLSQKRADGVAQSVGPYFKSQYHKKEKKNGASEWLEGMNKHAISPKSLLLTSWAHKITFRHTQPAQYT